MIAAVQNAGADQRGDAPMAGVTLVGRLQVGEFFGPPGYGESPATDALENSWYLQLPAPAATQSDAWPAASDDSGDASTEHYVQLVVPPALLPQARMLVGERVAVHGVPFARWTGHHRTAMLMEVDRLEPIASLREEVR